MDCSKVGELIRSLRIEQGFTQKQLADMLNISDKTVSKWERGLGCPDITLLVELANVLGVKVESILSGGIDMNQMSNGNMRQTKFYVCPCCGNILTSTGPAKLTCCDRKLEALEVTKADEAHRLAIEEIEGEWYITTNHEMTKTHYISFIAFVTGERLFVMKQYPEWGIHMRLPKWGHGILYSYCTVDGLKSQVL